MVAVGICTYEDRPNCFIGLKLLVLSLARHSPDLLLRVSKRGEHAGFDEWISRQPNAQLVDVPAGCDSGKNAKPYLIQEVLDEGVDRAIWIDADMIVAGSVRQFVDPDPSVFVTTEPVPWVPYQGSRIRAEGLGLTPTRDLLLTTNSSFIVVSREHQDLLNAWKQLMQREDYQAAQKGRMKDPPPHLGGDQNLLCALLGSDFGNVPLQMLRQGRDVVHCLGPHAYRSIDRVRNAWRGLPPLVHAIGKKPWNSDAPAHIRLSPYCYLARHYRDQVDEPMEWAELPDRYAKWMNRMAFGNASLGGLPDALRTELSMMRKRWIRRLSGASQ